MFFKGYSVNRRAFLIRKYFFAEAVVGRNSAQNRNYSGTLVGFPQYGSVAYKENILRHQNYWHKLLSHRKCYSNRLIDGDLTQSQKNQHESELKKITDLFPQPRAVLNELSAKKPDKIFDIYYKQNIVAPKGVKKKAVQNNDWNCSYVFVWPENIKFDGTAVSKRQAAEKAATQALHYLYTNKRIDTNGNFIYNKNVIENLRSTLNEPLKVSISGDSVERLDRIWSDYEEEIKDIYEATFKEARRKIFSSPATVTKDSTIDDEDGFSDDEIIKDEVADLSEIKVHNLHPVYGRPITPPTKATLEKRDRILRQKFDRYEEEIAPLPIDRYAKQITSTLENCRVALLVGAAGCGKSTRAPAAILRACGARTAAIVSEPRRVAAIGLAEMVARELGEDVGESIGYQVRLHARPPRPPGGSILYCTSGVLLRRLQANPGLAGCTHVIIDEAHERDVNTDVTLLLLKKALDINPQLKIIIMSATLDIQVFTRYFDSCPVIEVPGRAFPVEVSYLDEIQKRFGMSLPATMDNSLREDGRLQVNCHEVVQVIKAVDRTGPEGAILVFLPGWAEIKLAKQMLDQQFGTSTHIILPVHSRLSTTDQTKMFARALPGVRKIVLATNIAETSVTIPDVVHVVDSGAHKENRIREGTGTASLETVWVSQAGAKQRAGRAGRVQPGYCYRMYIKEKEEEFVVHTTPEILRIPLEQTVLDSKTYAPEDKVEDFLSQLPEPPSKKAIQFAVDDLIDLGALTPSGRLTRLGELVSAMALPPRLARAVLHAAAAGGVSAAATVATYCSDTVEVFHNAADRREEIREIKGQYSERSDHAALRWLQDEFERAAAGGGAGGARRYCERRGLRSDRLQYVTSITNLHLKQLLKSGIIEPTIDIDEVNRFSDVDELTVAILLSGSNCLLKTKKHVRTKGKLKTAVELFTSAGDRAHIASESVNYGITKRGHNHLLTYFGGCHSTERRALVVYKTSVIPPHTAVLFCMGDVRRENASNEDTTVLSLPRHKLQVHVPTSQADAILRAREMLWNTFKYYIERDPNNLDFEENTRISKFKVRLVKAVCRILVEANKQSGERGASNNVVLK